MTVPIGAPAPGSGSISPAGVLPVPVRSVPVLVVTVAGHRAGHRVRPAGCQPDRAGQGRWPVAGPAAAPVPQAVPGPGATRGAPPSWRWSLRGDRRAAYRDRSWAGVDPSWPCPACSPPRPLSALSASGAGPYLRDCTVGPAGPATRKGSNTQRSRTCGRSGIRGPGALKAWVCPIRMVWCGQVLLRCWRGVPRDLRGIRDLPGGPVHEPRKPSPASGSRIAGCERHVRADGICGRETCLPRRYPGIE